VQTDFTECTMTMFLKGYKRSGWMLDRGAYHTTRKGRMCVCVSHMWGAGAEVSGAYKVSWCIQGLGQCWRVRVQQLSRAIYAFFSDAIFTAVARRSEKPFCTPDSIVDSTMLARPQTLKEN